MKRVASPSPCRSSHSSRGGSAHAQTQLKIATLAPEGSSWMNAVPRVGPSNVEEHTARQDQGEVLRRRHRRATSATRCARCASASSTARPSPPSASASSTSEVRVLELPMLIKNYEELDYVRNKLDARLPQEVRGEGLRAAGLGRRRPGAHLLERASQVEGRPGADQAVGLDRRPDRARAVPAARA